MITDKVVNVRYENPDGTKGEVTMTITSDQLETTIRRRMQTLMPRTTNYRFEEVVQGDLGLKTAAKK